MPKEAEPPKVPVRFYLKESYRAELDKLMSDAGMNVTEYMSMVTVNWLEQQRAFAGATELESLHNYLKRNHITGPVTTRTLGEFVENFRRLRSIEIPS